MGSTDLASKGGTKDGPPQGGDPSPAYPEWAAAFQAYYSQQGQAAPGYYPQPSAAQPHPYMWGGQMMPPYGTPSHSPYAAHMYPAGAMYGHAAAMPSGSSPYMGYAMPAGMNPMDPSSHTAAASSGDDGKGSEVDEGSMAAAAAASSAAAAAAAFRNASHSAGAAGVGHPAASSLAIVPPSAAASAYGHAGAMVPGAMAGGQPLVGGAGGADAGRNGVGANGMLSTSGGDEDEDDDDDDDDDDEDGSEEGGGGGSGKGSNGMAYWQGKQGGATGANGMMAGGGGGKKRGGGGGMGGGGMAVGQNQGMPGELWLQPQDEREVKRQRRKQSNRESARRSRLRKQAECEELNERVQVLVDDNDNLRRELTRLNEECQKMAEQNAVLEERLNIRRSNGGNVPPLVQVPPEMNDDHIEALRSGGEGGERQMDADNGIDEGYDGQPLEAEKAAGEDTNEPHVEVSS